VVCTECENQWGSIHYAFEQGVSVCRLDGVASRLLVLYKDSNERRLSAVLAELMAAACPPQWLQWAELLAFVPCDGAALERRGFDHMERLAGDFSRLSGLPLAPLLAKQAGVDQRGLSRQRRFVNQRSAFSLQPDVTAADLFGRRILLLDDVMTTGATLDAAAVLLRASGAAAVRALTFCRTW
jgi:ComF family protein